MNKILLIFSIIFLLNFICANTVPTILNIEHSPEIPAYDGTLKICAKIQNDSELIETRILLEWESHSANLFLYSENELYCRNLTSSYFEAIEGKEVSYKISAKNSYGTSETSWYKFIFGPHINETENNQTDPGTNQTNSTQVISNRSSCGSIKFKQYCDSNWKCGSWTKCTSDGMMYRTCLDTNHCKISYNKPIETMACELTFKSKNTNNQIIPIFLIFNILITLILILILSLILKRKK